MQFLATFDKNAHDRMHYYIQMLIVICYLYRAKRVYVEINEHTHDTVAPVVRGLMA